MKQYDVLMPVCYQHFSCKGGGCRHTCCGGWSITMSRDEYRKMKRKIPDLKTKTRLVDEGRKNPKDCYEIVLDEEGECPFLTEDKLCDVQAKHGTELLINTCAIFPRAHSKYMNTLEYNLSLGCEKVLELLMQEPDGLELINVKELKPDNMPFNHLIDEKARRTYPVVDYYFDIQQLCFSLLQARDASLEDRILLLAMAIHRIDSLVKEKREKEIPDYIDQYLSTLETMDSTDLLKGVASENICVLYYNLVTATKYTGRNDNYYADMVDRIREKLQVTMEINETLKEDGTHESGWKCSLEAYQQHKEQFVRFRKDKDYYLENVMMSYLLYSNLPFVNLSDGVWKNFTYFIWVYCMTKFSLTMLLEEDSSDEDVVDYCVTLFRKLGHNNILYRDITETFIKNKSDSVAHMAVLLNS